MLLLDTTANDEVIFQVLVKPSGSFWRRLRFLLQGDFIATRSFKDRAEVVEVRNLLNEWLNRGRKPSRTSKVHDSDAQPDGGEEDILLED